MKNRSVLFLLAILFIFSCTSNPVDGVHIRVKNITQLEFENISVNTSGGEHNYGALSAGENSHYFQYDIAYRYAAINAQINGQNFILQPIDYVGETPLDDGFYRYEIGIDDITNRTLFLQFKEE